MSEDFGTEQDAAALASLVRAGRRAWAAASHPEPLIVACPRPGCGAWAGQPCTTTGGTVLPWGHRERHKAAIEADGRTCAARGGIVTETPAETIRRAAALMRERAEAAMRDGASKPPWAVGARQSCGCCEVVTDADGSQITVADDRQSGHIASWHPFAALAVADWLDAAAQAWDEGMEWDEALAVARAYLGEAARDAVLVCLAFALGVAVLALADRARPPGCHLRRRFAVTGSREVPDHPAQPPDRVLGDGRRGERAGRQQQRGESRDG